MWSFNKVFSAWIVIIALLSNCGFKPLSIVENNESSILGAGKFSFFSPKDEISFQIKEELLKNLGFPKRPTYKISIEGSMTNLEGLITAENEITRYNLILETNFKLLSLPENEIIYAKNVISQTAYSASKNVTGFATKTAENSAKERLAQDIAKKITMELLLLSEEL